MSKHSTGDVVLFRVYGPTRTLRSAVSHLASANPELVQDLHSGLSVRGDSPKYLELLDKARVVIDPASPALPSNLSLSQHSPQHEASTTIPLLTSWAFMSVTLMA